MATAENPFLKRGPIFDPKHFFGREREQRRIMALLKTMQADKKLMASLAKWKADEAVRKSFEKAAIYEQAKLYKRAAEHYRGLLEKHPDSGYAARARAKLAALKPYL